VKDCSSSNFRACGSKHHTLLHLGNLGSTSSQETSQSPEALAAASLSRVIEFFVFPSTYTVLHRILVMILCS